MVKRVGSIRKKSRQKFTKSHRQRGKIGLSRYFQEFKIGDNVALSAEPAIHKGTYHPRFYGRTGTITGRRGSCYEVRIYDFKKAKTLIVHPVHLLMHKEQ